MRTLNLRVGSATPWDITAGGTYTPRAYLGSTLVWDNVLNTSNWMSVTDLGTAYNTWTGWQGVMLKIGSSPISVVSLGRWMYPGSTGVHEVKIMLSAGPGAAPIPISGGSVWIDYSFYEGWDDNFVYEILSQPLTLAAGASYFIFGQETADGDFSYDLTYGNFSSVASNHNGAWLEDNGTASLAMEQNTAYGPVDFLYEV